MSAARVLTFAFTAAMLFAIAPSAAAQDSAYDPPDRVARIAYQSGDVEFASAGDDRWGSVNRNRPLSTGDRLTIGSRGQAALELGDASVRIDADSALDLLEIDSQVAQFELSQGTINLRVRNFDPGQTYEVDTPTVAFVASRPGSYRIDVAPDGDGSIVSVFSGAGTVYGEGGVSRNVTAGRSYRFDDSQFESVSVNRLPRRDAFDRFCFDRDSRYDRSISRRYVSDDLIGYDDLDQYGDWQASSEYGEVWYPNDVGYGWAPYRYGQWQWIDPWGWTWVDDRPWGFAPSHYGRWAYIDNRWGWLPCRSRGHSIYAPALVAFISLAFGGDQPVGWYPLGPRDVYQPWYPVSRNYFTNVNISNTQVINTTIINNVYNSYVNNTTIVNPPVSANRSAPGAVTVVPRNVFTGARPVAAAAMRIQPQALAQARVTPMLRVAPSIASLGVAATSRPAHASGQLFERPVIARHAPPAPAAPLAVRMKMISDQGGAPLAQSQLRDLRQAHASEQHAAPRVVLAAPGGGTIRALQGEPNVRPAPRAAMDGAQPPGNPNVPRVETARPQPDALRDRGVVHAPRVDQRSLPMPNDNPAPRDQPEPRVVRAPHTDMQIPRAAVQSVPSQDAQERSPREDRRNLPMRNGNPVPRDQPEPRVMQRPESRVMPQRPPQADVVEQRANERQTYAPRPLPREDQPSLPMSNENPAPRDQPEPRVMRAPRTVQATPALPERQVQQHEPRERPVVAPRQQVQPHPQTVEQPAPVPQEKRKPKHKDEQQQDTDTDTDTPDQQH